ncbi:MAG: S9 family peptidase [Chloroflexi bacterium]|nr:S9 family peptidase [Chloroflexota bacterium]MDA1145269.1 S9 family peptidase [Chloroflexota bacterium]
MPATRPIDPSMLVDLDTVAEPAISPDGGAIAYVRGAVDPTTLQRSSVLELVPFEGGTARQLTAGPLDSRPTWSPHGKTVAFLRSRRDDDGSTANAQVWLLPIDGGEARQLTSLAGPIRSLAWLPNGGALVLAVDVDPDAPAPTANPSIPRAKRVNRIYFRADGLGWRGDTHRQLFRVDLDSGEAKQLTRGDYDCYSPTPSPDGASIAFASGDRSAQRERRTPGKLELCVVPSGGGAVRRIVRNLSGLSPIAWSPQGDRLAFVSGGQEYAYAQSYLWTVALEDGAAPKQITDDSLQPTGANIPLADPPPMHWGARRITFQAERHGSTGLYSTTPSGSTVEPLRATEELGAGLSLSADATRAAVLNSRLTRPNEVTAVDIEDESEHAVSAVSTGYLEGYGVGKTERFTFQRGGLDIECWLTFPPDFDRKKKYPLVLEVHGGPNGFFGNGWMPLHQMLAGAGYLVLYINPRGSSTYGRDFVSRVFEDWGGEDYEDQMAAVDRVLRRNYVDASRLAIHGYSYGGFMTSWTVGHTDRFKTAIVAAPVTNLVSMYGQSDISVQFGEQQWGGTPLENFEAYVAHSPITYAPNVKTPVLLLHGEADIRCPISQSEEYYTALKRLGKQVEFVRFPGGYHGFVRAGHPAMVRSYHEHVLDWLKRTL